MSDTASVPKRLILAFALFAGLAGGGAPSVAQQERAIGQVVNMRGEALAVRGGETNPLRLGAAVHLRDRVVTRPESKVEIEFGDGSRLIVGAGTEVELTEYAPGSRGANGRGILTLLIGIIRTSLDDVWAAKGFEVRTRAAVASVRSTEWVTEAKSDATAVFVVSGAVEVVGTQSGRSVTVMPDFGTDVGAGGPSAPVRWGAARVRDVLARTRIP